MTPKQLFDLVLLAAIWGASFLFMRVGSPEFGPVTLIFFRVGIGAAVLLPVLIWRGQFMAMLKHAGPLFAVGVLNSAIPFTLFAYATLYITAGLAAILNSTTPLFTALVAYLWLHERLETRRAWGLFVGFAGVAILMSGRAALPESGGLLAAGATLLATLCYGISALYTKRRLTGVSALTVSTGSLIGATLAMLLPALWLWPEAAISLRAWVSVIALGILCTGLAFLLYFRLLANVGPTRAVTVTFMIPLFGMLWGSLLLGEQITLHMVLGGGVILLGTALAAGVLRFGRVVKVS